MPARPNATSSASRTLPAPTRSSATARSAGSTTGSGTSWPRPAPTAWPTGSDPGPKATSRRRTTRRARRCPPSPARRVRPRRGFTRRRAWIATIGGLVIFVGGVAVSLITLSLHDADDRIRADTIAAHVTRVDGDIAFVTEDGTRVQVPAPDLGEQGRSDVVRYYPNDPEHIVVVKDTVGRDITLAIVALKLLISGPILTVLGVRRLLQLAHA